MRVGGWPRAARAPSTAGWAGPAPEFRPPGGSWRLAVRSGHPDLPGLSSRARLAGAWSPRRGSSRPHLQGEGHTTQAGGVVLQQQGRPPRAPEQEVACPPAGHAGRRCGGQLAGAAWFSHVPKWAARHREQTPGGPGRLPPARRVSSGPPCTSPSFSVALEITTELQCREPLSLEPFGSQ